MIGRMEDERDLSGTVLAGRYRVLARIGSGGMGTIYAGEHLEVGRKVAIKILRPDIGLRPVLVERFRREARYIARIEHEHVVECLDLGLTDDGLLFYVMEWLRGEDLQARLKRERRLPWPRARAILAQLCRALAAAHAQGVVHRDLKPGNLFLINRADNHDYLKVLDFGIAKLMAPDDASPEVLTRTGEVIGTTPYMAPELAAGEAIDHRVDVYAAGVIMFQLLTGRLPFRGKTPRQVLTAILQGDAPTLTGVDPRLVVSPALAAVLQRAMHRDLELRFPDMAALHDALLELPDDACVRMAGDDAASEPSASEPTMPVTSVEPGAATPPASSAAVLRGETMTPSSGPHDTMTPGSAMVHGETMTPSAGPHATTAPPRPARRGLLVGLGALALAAGIALAGLRLELFPALTDGAQEPATATATADAVVATAPTAAVALAESTPGADEQTALPADAAGLARPEAAVAEPGAIAVVVPGGDTGTESRGRSRSEGRADFEGVMQRASNRVRICLAQAGLKSGTRVRFDIAVEARTGRISAANPRDPHRARTGLGACVVEAARGAAVRPAPPNEWRRSYEFTS